MLFLAFLVGANAVISQNTFFNVFINDEVPINDLAMADDGSSYILRNLNQYFPELVHLDSSGNSFQTWKIESGGGNGKIAFSSSTQHLGYCSIGAINQPPLIFPTVLLMDFDAPGSIIYANNAYNTQFSPSINSISAEADNAYFVGGRVVDYNQAVPDYQGFIAKFDKATGHFLAGKSFGEIGASETFMQVKYHPELDLVLACGQTNGFGASMIRGYVVALDTNLNKLWSIIFDTPTTFRAEASYVEDSTIYIGGQLFRPGSSFTDGTFSRLDHNGNILDFKTFSIINNDRVQDILKMANGNWLLAGTHIAHEMVAFDSSFVLQWALAIGYVDFPYGKTALNLAKDQITAVFENDFANPILMTAVVRGNMDGTGFPNCNNYGFNPSFGSLSVNSIPASGDEYPLILQDSFFTPSIVPEPLQWLDACSVFVALDAPAEEQMSLKPNPAREICELEFLGGNLDLKEVEMLDIQGRRIRNWKLEAGQSSLQIDIRPYSPGIYFIKAIGENGCLTKKLLVQ